jgi:hypothetical protein
MPSISLPEAAGLPVDETFTYLALMKRYIVHGAQPGIHISKAATSLITAGLGTSSVFQRVQSMRTDNAGSPVLSSSGAFSRSSHGDGGGG